MISSGIRTVMEDIFITTKLTNEQIFRLWRQARSLLKRSPSETLRIARRFLEHEELWAYRAVASRPVPKDLASVFGPAVLSKTEQRFTPEELQESLRRCRPNHPEACQWDVLGAVALACNEHAFVPHFLVRVLDELACEVMQDDVTIGEASDFVSHARMLALLDVAAQRVAFLDEFHNKDLGDDHG
jgi:hypothetical protein